MKKIHKVLLIVLGAVLVVLLVLYVVLPLVAIGFEDWFVKCDMDNEYVDNDYDGWQAAEIQGAALMLPETWQLSQNGSIVTDEDGTLIAEVLLPSEEIEDCLCDYYNVPEVTISTEVQPALYITSSFFSKINIVLPDGSQREAYYLNTRPPSSERLTIVFFDTPSVAPYEKLFRIAQAIAFSVGFPDSVD